MNELITGSSGSTIGVGDLMTADFGPIEMTTMNALPPAEPDPGHPSPAPALRVGVDLCAVHDVEAAIARFGDRYLQAVFTPAELASCQTDGRQQAERLAARFAAKEATMKVLRPDDEGIDLRSVEIRRQPGGWCDVHLVGSAAILAKRANIDSFAVSMSHEGGMAAAVVIAETRPRSASTPEGLPTP